MRFFVLLPFLAAYLSAEVMGTRMLANLISNSDDADIPEYTQAELDVLHRIKINIGDLGDIMTYRTKAFLSSCKRVVRRVLIPPPNHVFTTITNNDAVVYEPTKFLGYKVVVDSVEDTPMYIRMDGFLREGVVASRYFVRTEQGWDMLPRMNFIKNRIKDGNVFDIDFYSYDNSWKENMIVREIQWSHGPMVVMYPKFNKYIMEVYAGPRGIWNFDPVKTDLVVKILQYAWRGNNYIVLTIADWNGTSQDVMYIEDEYGFSHVGHSPQRHLGRTSGVGSRRRPGEYRDPQVLDIKPPVPKHLPYGVITDGQRIMFMKSKLIQVNFRRSPHPLVDEGWVYDVKGYPNGDYMRIITAKQGYLMYKLVDHDRYVFDFPGYAVRRANHLITNDGKQFLRLEAIDKEGQPYEYHYQKVNGKWEWIDKWLWDRRTNMRLNYLLFNDGGEIDANDLTVAEADELSQYVKVDLDINKEVYYAWSTERSSILGVITRKIYTAVDGHAFKSLNEDGVTFFTAGDKYLIRKVIHYKVMGMELAVLLSHDIETGKKSHHYLIRHRGKWMDVTQESYHQNLAIVLTSVQKWAVEHNREHYCPMLSNYQEDETTLNPFVNPYFDPNQVLDVPHEPLIDGHEGGLMLQAPPNQEVIDKAATTKGIRLELRGYREERYNIIAMSTGEKYFRVIYRPATGYHFNSVLEYGLPVFNYPGFVVTEVALDETPDKEYFLQINAYDSNGKQHVFYYYKVHIHNKFQEISRKTYNNLRRRAIIVTEIDIGKANKKNKNVVKLVSKHFDNVISYLPRINVIVREVKHGNSTIWKYDDRTPEIITRVVNFTRQGIRGCLIHYIDEFAVETEKLYLNTNPKTNQYVQFVHKGEMFSMFKNYLQNRKTGFAWSTRYLPDEINWTEVVSPDSPEYELCQPGKKIKPKEKAENEEQAEGTEEAAEGDAAADEEEDVIDLTEMEEETEEAKEDQEEQEEELTEEQKKARDAVEARKKHTAQIHDNIYYSDKKFAMKQVIHKEGVVWDSSFNGQLCLDVRKFRRGQYRLIQCEIMSPDGKVEIRYFMNTHNGRGNYQEISVSEFGSDF